MSDTEPQTGSEAELPVTEQVPVAEQEVVLVVADANGQRFERQVLTLNGHDRVTVGRAWNCDVIVQDAQVDAEHLYVRLADDGKLYCADLGSLNGVRLAGLHIDHEQEIQSGAELRFGKSRLKVFAAEHAVAPAVQPSRWDSIRDALDKPLWSALSLLGLVGLQVLSRYVGSTRPLEADTVVSTVLSSVSALGVWVLFWGVLSKLMRNDLHLRAHLAIAATGGIVSWIIDGLASWIGWQTLSLEAARLAATFGDALIMFAVAVLTLGIATRLRRRPILVLAAVPPLLLLMSVYLLPLLRDERQQWGPEFVTESYPPGWLLSGGEKVADFTVRTEGLFAASVARATRRAEELAEERREQGRN